MGATCFPHGMIARCVVATTLVALSFTLGSAAGSETTYPRRPVRLVVPFPAGGGSDISARTLTVQLEKQFGQSIVVDNRGGANGIIGTDIVAKAAPDGHTLLYVSSSIAINPGICFQAVKFHGCVYYQPMKKF